MKDAKPDALDVWNELQARLVSSGVVVLLDYDGTLTPIAQRPDLAVLSPAMRDTLRRVANCWPTAIVTGRALDQIQKLVGMPELTYAASHGFDIEGPGVRYQVGKESQKEIDKAFEEITERIDRIEGVLIENKVFTIAVHFRLVAPDRTAAVIAATREVAAAHGLRVTGGKMVIEMRPDIDWDKGTAVRWLAARHAAYVPLFIGDDATDEDAFRAIRDDGIGVLVASTPRETTASYMLPDVAGVEELLRRLSTIPSGTGAPQS